VGIVDIALGGGANKHHYLVLTQHNKIGKACQMINALTMQTRIEPGSLCQAFKRLPV
jgi:hypothetical protein